MDIDLEAAMAFTPSAVLAEVADLPGYTDWHGMVHKVDPDGDGWMVDVGGRLGPFTKTKRVRLVRTADEAPGHVRFVRAERDRDDFGRWELAATVDPAEGDGPCTLHLRLLYDGSSPLAGLLEPVLRAETDKSAARLRTRLASRSG